MLFLWLFGTEKTPADVSVEHKLFRLFLVSLAWLYIKLITVFGQRITGKWIWLLNGFLTLPILYRLARKAEILFESERFCGLLVKRVEMRLFFLPHGVTRNRFDFRTRRFVIMLVKVIQIEIVVFERGSRIVIVIIIYHYWQGFDLSQNNIV